MVSSKFLQKSNHSNLYQVSSEKINYANDNIVISENLFYPDRKILIYKSNYGEYLYNDYVASIDGPDESIFGKDVVVDDFNIDGFDDIIVSSLHYIDNQTVRVFNGPFEINILKNEISYKEANYFIEPPVELLEGWGNTLSAIGDVDDDGYSDLIVSVPYLKNYIVSMKDKEISELYNTSETSSIDANGDGVKDIIAFYEASPIEEYVYIYFGSKDIGEHSYDIKIDFPSGSHDPTVLKSGADYNGDGHQDFVVGMSGADNHENVYIFYGDYKNYNNNLTDVISPDDLPEFADIGSSITSVGDIDQNGSDDLAIGAASTDFDDSSFVYVFAMPDCGSISYENAIRIEFPHNDAFGGDNFELNSTGYQLAIGGSKMKEVVIFDLINL